jgi:hypothetical protein
MATYLDRVAAAGARVNLEAQPTPAAPPILPGMGTPDHAPAEGGSVFHPAMENRTEPPTTPAVSDTVHRGSAEPANAAATRSSEPESPRMATEAETATTASISPTKSTPSPRHGLPLPARVSVSSDLNPDRSPTPPAATLPLPPGAQPSAVAPAGRASQARDRAPRVTTRVNTDPTSVRVSDLSALSALSVPTPLPAATPSREHNTDAAEIRGREIADVTPRSTPAEDSVSQSASAAMSQPTIAVSPASVAHASTSRSSEAEPRITIGRVDVLVNNQLPPRPVATVAPSDATGAHIGLRAHFLDRFTLRP